MRYRNFKGEKGKFNAEGQRSVAFEVNPTQATELVGLGFTVRETQPNPDYDDVNEFESVLYLPVKIRYDIRPPAVYLISKDVRTFLSEDTVAVLDSLDADYVDAIISPYNWTLGDKVGTSAYLRELYVTITPSPLAEKYGTHGAEAAFASMPDEKASE